MGSFTHTGNTIIINDEYRFPIELFMKLEPDYSLPNGIILRKYVQGKTHFITSGFMEKSQPLNWNDGDRYINRLSELIYLEQDEKIREEERKEHVRRIKLEEERARSSLLEKKKQ